MIRFKVFIPVVLIFALISGVLIFCIDGWVKNALEDAISMVTNTRTDITKLKISFMNSSLSIRRLEIASSSNEFKNLVELNDIVIDFQTLPLLKKRFVVDEFSINGILWGTKRSVSGRLPVKAKTDEKPGWFSEFKETAIDKVKSEFEHMPVSQFTDFRIPSDPREVLDRMELKSTDAYKGVITHAQELRGRWVDKIKDIKDTRAIEAKIRDVRALAKDVPQNPQEIIARVQSAQESIEFFKKEQTRISKYVDDVKVDVEKIQTDYKNAVEAVRSDFERAKSMVSLDQLKLDNISRLLFGPEALKKVEEVLRIHRLMRQMMASNSKDEEVQVRKRAKGRDIIFVTERREPGFVLAKSDFSVKGVEAGDRTRLAQVYDLKLRDINSSPKLYKKPSTVDFRGEFKDAVLNEAIFHALWDYTQEVPVDDFKIEARKIKADSWPMGIPQYFPLKIQTGVANAKSQLRFDGDQMKSSSKIEFSGVVWDFKEIPKQGMIVDLLQHVFERIKNFAIEVELKNENGELGFDVRSDLDSVVKVALQDEIQKRISEFQARLKQDLENRVGKYQVQAENMVKGFQNEFQSQAENSLKQTIGYQDEVGNIQDEIKRKGQKQATDKLKDVLKGGPSGDDPLKKLKKLF